VIPDIEVLRVYLILPLYHEFLQPKFFEELHFPFACVLLGLKPEAGKVYGTTKLFPFEKLKCSSIDELFI
jgi:hypothetical protein